MKKKFNDAAAKIIHVPNEMPCSQILDKLRLPNLFYPDTRSNIIKVFKGKIIQSQTSE